MGKVIKTKITEQQAQEKVAAADLAAQFAALDNKIDAESDARTNSDALIADDLAGEKTIRAADDSQLQSNIDNEAKLRADADDILISKIDAEKSARISADENLAANFNSNFAQEIADRNAAISDMQNAILVSLGDSQALQNIENENLKKSISEQAAAQSKNLAALSSNLDKEISERKAADSALNQILSTESAARSNADSTLNSKIDKEISDRVQALNDLQNAILVSLGDLQSLQNIENENLKKSISEQATAQSGSVQSLSSKLEQEISERKAADSSILNNLSQEVDDRKAAAETLAQTIADESAARISADETLNSKIEAEISTRTSEVSKLSKAISDEVTARSNAINNLISSLNSTINSKASDTLNEAKSYADTKFNSVESSLNDFTAATATANGTHGLVPAPPKGTQLLVLTNYGWRQLDDAAVQIADAPNQANVLTFNGSSQSPTWANFDSNKMSIGGTTSATNAGTYTATFTPKDFYTWADSKDQSPKSVTWTIGALLLDKPSAAVTTFTYDPSAVDNLVLDIDNVNEKFMSHISGTREGRYPSDYEITYQLKNKNNTTWKDGTTDDVTINWKINPLKLSELQSSGFAQEGTINFHRMVESPTISHYDMSVHSLGGTTSARNAGTYTITISPNLGYTWADGTTTPKEISWTIGVQLLFKPTVASTDFTYNAKYQNLVVSFAGFYSNYLTETGKTSAREVGNYSVAYSINDKNNYAWSDGTTDDFVINWSIARKAVAKPYANADSFTFNGNSQAPTIQNYKATYMTVSGDESATNAGTYHISYDVKANYCWEDASTDTVVVDWTIEKQKLPKPYAKKTSFNYDGSQYRISVQNYVSELMTRTGNIYYKEVGDYSVSFDIKNKTNYCWEDGTTDPVVVTWSVIEQGKLYKPSLFYTEYDFQTSGTIEPVILNYDSETMAISGTTSAPANEFSTNTVTISIIDKTANTWADGSTNDITLTWYVSWAYLQRPSLSQSQFTYTGADISALDYLVDFDENYMEIVDGGWRFGRYAYDNYQFKIAIKDKNHCAWSSAPPFDDHTITWQILPVITARPTLTLNQFDFTGDAVNILDYLAGFDSNLQTVRSGTTSASSAGNYSFTIAIKGSSNPELGSLLAAKWDDGSTDSITFNWVINSNGLAKPVFLNVNPNAFVYNGAEQAPTLGNFNSDTMTVSGTQAATNVGSYSVTIALKDKTNTTWNDGTTADVTLTWTINQKKFTKPALSQNAFDYSGAVISITNFISNFDANFMNAANYSKTNAGTYTATVSLKDKTNTAWNDGSTENISLTWIINPLKVTKPSLSISALHPNSTTFGYSGDVKTPIISNFNADLMTKSGTESATDAGEYSITFALKDKKNYIWANNSTGDIDLIWRIKPKTIAAPTLSQNEFTYSGYTTELKGDIIWNSRSVKILDYISGFDSETMTTNATSHSEAGTYYITVSLKDKTNTAWANGDSDDLLLIWKINKAILPMPTLAKSAFDYTGETFTPDVQGFDSETMILVTTKGYDNHPSTLSASAAGTYFIVIRYRGSGFEWADSSNAYKNEIQLQWQIVSSTLTESQSNLSVKSSPTFTLDNSGNVKTFTLTNYISNFDANYMTASGTTTANAAGDYSLKISPKVGYTWSDGSKSSKDFTVTIKKLVINSAFRNVSKVYCGKQMSVALQLNNAYYSASGVTGTNAGTYTATLKLKYPASTIWSDNTTADKTVTWTIEKAALEVPTIANTFFPVDGTAKSIEIEGFDSATMIKSGTESASALGTYAVTFALKNPQNYRWNGSDDSKITVNWTIGANKIPVPTLSVDAPTWGLIPNAFEGDSTAINSGYFASTVRANFHINGFNSELMTATYLNKPIGASHQYNYSTAGTPTFFKVVVSLKDKNNYTWSDGTTDDKQIQLYIPTFTIPKDISEMQPIEIPYDGNAHRWYEFFAQIDSVACYAFREVCTDSVVSLHDFSATSVGTYSFTLTPLPDMKWFGSDGKAKTFNLVIKEA